MSGAARSAIGWSFLWLSVVVGVLRGEDGTSTQRQVERLKFLTLSRMEQALVEEKRLDELMTTLYGLDQSQAAVPLLLHGLKKANQEYADYILRELADIYPPSEEVIDALLDVAEGFERNAVERLVQLGPEILPRLVQQLDSQDLKRRRRVLIVAIRMAQEDYPHLDYSAFVPAVVQLLQSESSRNRVLALQCLQAFGPSGQAALPELIETLQIDEANFSACYSAALGGMGRPAAVAIPALLRSPKLDEQQLVEIARALERLGPAAVKPLGELLSHRSQDVRAAAARALGRMGPEAAGCVAELRRLLADSDWIVRVEAAVAVWSVSGDVEPLAPALTEALDHDVQFVMDKVRSLGPSGRCVVAKLAGLLADRADPLNRWCVLQAIDALGPEAAELVPVLMQQLAVDRKDYGVQQALVRIGPAARRVLMEALKSEDGKVRADAYAVLGIMGLGSRTALEDLLHLAERETGEPREVALSALEEMICEQASTGFLAEMMELADRHEVVANVLVAKLTLSRVDDIREMGPVFQVWLKQELADCVEGLSAAEIEYRSVAAYRLLRLGRFARPAIPQLRLALDDIDLRVHLQAAAALWAAGASDERPRQILIAGLRHPHPRTRAEVADLFKSIGPPAAPAVGHLVGLLSEPKIETRIRVAEAIARIDPDQPELIPALMKLLEDHRVRARDRGGVAAILQTLGPRAKPQLPRLRRLQFLEEDPSLVGSLIEAQQRIAGEGEVGE